MKKCAFLTTDNLDDFVCMDRLLIAPMAAAGWAVEEVSWHQKDVDWRSFHLVIIRSPWDYQSQPDAFLDVLETIAAQTHLENSLSTVRWNLDKSYLKELQSKGIEIVPTRWDSNLKPGDLKRLFDTVDSAELILKPVISANADDTFRLDFATGMRLESMLCDLFSRRRFMVQPFINSIVSEGEFSLFYFGGQYSHAILKTPKSDDFRVQEEHGGTIKSIGPSEIQLTIGHEVIQALDETPLYARVDLVRIGEDQFALMELELIEPSLYFDTDANSIENFIEQLEIKWHRLPATVKSTASHGSG